MGKHTSARNTGRVTALAVAAVIAVLGGGTWAVAALMDDDPASTSAKSSTSSVTSTPTASPSVEDSPSPSASSTADQQAALSEERHARCVSEVKAATQLVNAVATSASHWGLHVSAQKAWAARTQPFARTQAQWAESKAAGPADEKAFAAASKAAGAAKGACREAVSAGSAAEATTACMTRLEALEAAGRTGTAVHRQWAEHLAMMRDKEHTDKGAYHQRWLGMVKSAEGPLKAHAGAAAAVTKTPACA